jgi:hypothetical protein
MPSNPDYVKVFTEIALPGAGVCHRLTVKNQEYSDRKIGKKSAGD